MPLLRFGTFEIDSNTGELRKSGLLISLPPQPFRILALLASHPGELMTREDIRRQIWDDGTFVDFEQGLNIAINKIRAVLGDNAESPRYVETLPRRGYRFIAPVQIIGNHESCLTGSIGDGLVKPFAIGTQQEPSRPRLRLSLLLLLTATTVAIVVWLLKTARIAAPQSIARLAVTLPPETSLDLDPPSLAISPDGSLMVYAAVHAGTSRLYMRSLDQMEARPIPGSQGGQFPFFSPDVQWLGFFADGKLKKAPVSGGPPMVICEALAGRGGSWGENGTIIFAPEYRGGLYAISGAGGVPKALTSPDSSKGEGSYRWPHLLPGGKEVLFTILGTTKADAQIVVQSLKTGQRRVLIHGAGTARYVPIGYLAYSQDGTLMAAPFNLRRVELTGAPRPVAENIAESVAAAFDFSRFGSLVYIPQAPGTADRTLVWVDRNGTVQPLALPPHRYGWPRVSPDGRSLAVTNNDDGDVWCYGIARGHFSRVTFGGKTGWPIWSPDGKRLAYASKTAGHWDMFSKAADGSGPEELLMGSEHSAVPQAWSPDGQLLAFIGEEVSTGLSIGLLPIRGRRQSRQLLQTAFVVMEPTFSPDGRWLAYASNESGRYEVYVQPFPSLNGKWQVSTEGGREPVWARNPRELFYRNGGKMMAVNIVTQPSFQAAKPHLLFEGHYATDPIRIRNYDVMPDGRRFVMVKPSRQEMEAAQINIVFNWFEELNRQFKKDQKQ